MVFFARDVDFLAPRLAAVAERLQLLVIQFETEFVSGMMIRLCETAPDAEMAAALSNDTCHLCSQKYLGDYPAPGFRERYSGVAWWRFLWSIIDAAKSPDQLFHPGTAGSREKKKRILS